MTGHGKEIIRINHIRRPGEKDNEANTEVSSGYRHGGQRTEVRNGIGIPI